MNKIKDFSKRITKRQWFLMAYLPIHFTWYFIIEAVNVANYTVVYSRLDDLIPFCEWFVFPYLIWFLYMMIPGIYYLAKNADDFENYMLSLLLGLFVSMTIVTIFPTGQELRVDVDPGKNLPSWLVAFVYDFDTNTNVFPSMHVVGSIAVAFCLSKSRSLRQRKLLNVFIWCLGLAIISATVFLKQHSILDVFAGIAVELGVLAFVYSGMGSKLLDKITGTTKETV